MRQFYRIIKEEALVKTIGGKCRRLYGNNKSFFFEFLTLAHFLSEENGLKTKRLYDQTSRQF